MDNPGESKPKKEVAYNVFISLGAIWLIVGLVVFHNTSLWPLGFIFLLVGLVGKYGKKPSRDPET